MARRHGLNRNQLFQWRRQFREGVFGGAGADEGFVPVVGDCRAAEAPLAAAMMAGDAIAGGPGAIEVVVGAMIVRVPAAVDEATLRRVLGVVRSLA